MRKGGLVIADNTFLFGNVYDENSPHKQSEKNIKAMRELNERLADETRYDGIIIPTIEGLTIGIKKF